MNSIGNILVLPSTYVDGPVYIHEKTFDAISSVKYLYVLNI